MNKQLVQEIINAGNKDMDSVDNINRYYDYNGLYYDDNHVEYVDEYDDEINLSYEDSIDNRVGVD